VVVDLSAVEYVGGDMLRALYDLHEQLAHAGTELRLVAPAGSRCARSVALTGLDAIIPTFADATHAWRHRHGRVS
jgi:anti-anti-sigma factor